MAGRYGRPDAIHRDNGSELTSQVLTDWAAARGITQIYIQSGTPVQNAFIERFNRTVREEVPNAYLFHSTAERRRCPTRGSSTTINTGPMTRWAACRP